MQSRNKSSFSVTKKKIVGTIIVLLCLLGLVLARTCESPQAILAFILIGLMAFYSSLCLSREDILHSISYLTPFVGAAYLVTYPLLYFVFNLLPTPFRDIDTVSVINGTTFGGVMLLLYSAVVLLLQGNIPRGVDNSIYRKFSMPSAMTLLDGVFFTVILLYLYALCVQEGIGLLFIDSSARGLVNEAINSIPLFIYLKYALIAYSVYVLFTFLNNRSNSVKNSSQVIRLIFILVFWLAELSIGNRRGIIYIVLALCLYYTRKPSDYGRFTNVFAIGIVVFLVVLFSAISVFRDPNSVNQEIAIRNAFGELIMPDITLYYYIGKEDIVFLNGLSFVSFPLMLIPRALFPSKPVSLANQFMVEYDTTMGYAYTPFTEFYCNFGYYGCILGGLFLALTLCWLTKNRFRYPILYLCVMMELVNYFRGEFSSTVFEIVIMYITFKLLLLYSSDSKGGIAGWKQYDLQESVCEHHDANQVFRLENERCCELIALIKKSFIAIRLNLKFYIMRMASA